MPNKLLDNPCMPVAEIPFICHQCCIVFSNETDFRHHEFIRHRYLDSDSKRCDFCQIDFLDRAKFLDHMKDHEKRLFMCDQCPKAFHNNTTLKNHKCTHTSKRITCPHCDQKFRDTSGMKEHVKIIHEKILEKCNLCHKQVKYLRMHMANVHKEKEWHRCKICNKDYSKRALLKAHHQRSHEKRSFMCDQCPKTFCTNDHLKRHKLTHMSKMVSCLHCDQKFRHVFAMKQHVKFIHENKIDKCSVCDKQVKYLREHMISVHKEKQRHRCTICNKDYAKRALLKAHHLRFHDKDSKPEQQCEECGKMVPSSEVKYHKRAHRISKIPQKRVVCEICGKSIGRSGMSLHMAVHKGENPFKCEWCGKGFPRQQSLEMHIVVHTKERKYVCTICGKRYTQRTSLATHTMNVHSLTYRKRKD